MGSLLMIPCLPIIYIQGKLIRKKTPRLPEANGGSGSCVGKSNKELNIIFIGESTFAGVGVETHENGFAGIFANELASKLNVTVHWKVHAKSGYTAKNVVEKILPTIPKTSVDLIIVGLGGNDAFMLNNPWSWRKQMERLIIALKEKFGSAPIIFANMPPIKEFPAFTFLIKFFVGNLVEILGRELERLTPLFPGVHFDARKITVKDWERKMNGEEHIVFFSDGVHPSKLTYRIWAEELSEFVVQKTII